MQDFVKIVREYGVDNHIKHLLSVELVGVLRLGLKFVTDVVFVILKQEIQVNALWSSVILSNFS